MADASDHSTSSEELPEFGGLSPREGHSPISAGSPGSSLLRRRPMSPLEQGGLFHSEQGTGLLEAPPAAGETSGEDLGVFSRAASVYRLGEDWRLDPLLQYPPLTMLLA